MLAIVTLWAASVKLTIREGSYVGWVRPLAKMLA
jgi:hypothetical protein